MDGISQSDFDKNVTHTIRIELMDGDVLIYRVSIESKNALRRTLLNEDFNESKREFLWIYIPHDRLVFINKKDLVRITFCFDPIQDTQTPYIDNFSSTVSIEEESVDDQTPKENDLIDDFIPQLIIKHNRQMETTEVVKGVTMSVDAYFDNISSYSSLNEGDLSGFEFYHDEDLDEFELIQYEYLQFIDDDGEENFMPTCNLSVIETERPFFMTDELLGIYLGS